MNHGLPNGLREDEVTSFTTEHPNGVEATFEREDENGWLVTKIEAYPELGMESVLMYLDYLIADIEREGDALVLNRDEPFQDMML